MPHLLSVSLSICHLISSLLSRYDIRHSISKRKSEVPSSCTAGEDVWDPVSGHTAARVSQSEPREKLYDAIPGPVEKRLSAD